MEFLLRWLFFFFSLWFAVRVCFDGGFVVLVGRGVCGWRLSLYWNFCGFRLGFGSYLLCF